MALFLGFGIGIIFLTLKFFHFPLEIYFPECVVKQLFLFALFNSFIPTANWLGKCKDGVEACVEGGVVRKQSEKGQVR